MHIIKSTQEPRPAGTWAIGGPRQLDPAGVRITEAATLALLAAGQRLSVGCCTGADATAITAAVQARAAEQLLIWSAFGPVSRTTNQATAGTCRWSAPGAVALPRACNSTKFARVPRPPQGSSTRGPADDCERRLAAWVAVGLPSRASSLSGP